MARVAPLHPLYESGWSPSSRGKVIRRSQPDRLNQAAMAACPLLGDGVTDDTLLHVARFLSTARDILRLQLTNKRLITPHSVTAHTVDICTCEREKIGF